MSTKFILSRLALVGVGVAVALACVLVFITLFPSVLPNDERLRDQTIQVQYTDEDGDLFYHLPGDVKPPPENRVLSEHRVIWDKDGFRQPAQVADQYPIIVLGDSFTEAWMVAEPWTDTLAREIEQPVRPLAYRGYGPEEYLEIFEEYGEQDHEWVIVAFFEGNDLQNIRSSQESEDDSGLNRLQETFNNSLEDRPKIIENPDGNYRYPLALYIGPNFYELAFFDSYLWVLNGVRETYEDSRNIDEFARILGEIDEASGEACLAVVYLPTKGHIYFPYAEPFGRRWILENFGELELVDDGWLEPQLDGVQSEYEDYLARLGNMRDVVGETVTANGWGFWDLTPAFEAAAAEGEMTYFAYDTHWNQNGQRLAGETVAEYLRGATCEK